MRKGIDKKIVDSDSEISTGGRLRDYWARRGMKQKRSGFVVWNGEDIPLQEVLKQYNLAGFEFGRYVNNEDRNDFLIAAKESLSDLSGLIHSNNIGFDRHIGVAFGARGMGGSAIAHYEPMLNMINLTKNKGFGALAHEYGHALDYNIGTYVDQNKNYAALSGGRSMAKFPAGNTGGDCRTLMARLVYEIKMTASFGRLKKAGDYWHYNTEVFARFFEQWVCYKLREKKKQNDCLTNSWYYYTTGRPYLTEADFRKVLPTAEKLIKNMGLVLEGKKTEPATPLEIVKTKEEKPKVEQPKKAARPKAEPKPKKVAKPKAKTKAPETQMKLVYQNYDRAFAALSKLTLNDPVKPSLATVYHDQGDMVATDAHILAVIHEAKYPKQKEGKAVFARKWNSSDKAHPVTHKPSEVYDGKYPNYKAVFPKNLDLTTNIDLESELERAKKHLEYEKKIKAEAKKSQNYYAFLEGKGANSGGVIPYKLHNSHFQAALLVKALRLLKDAGLKKAVLCQYSDGRAGNRASVLIGNNLEVLVMPVMKNN